MLDVKGFLDSPLHVIHKTCKSSQLRILNVFKCKMLRFLKFWCKSNTRRIVETFPFRFLRDYFGDTLNVMLPSFLTIFYRFPQCFYMFPLVFLPFSRVILLFSLSVSPFPILDFAEKYDTFIVRLLNFLSFCDVNTLSKRLMLSSEKKNIIVSVVCLLLFILLQKLNFVYRSIFLLEKINLIF